MVANSNETTLLRQKLQELEWKCQAFERLLEYETFEYERKVCGTYTTISTYEAEQRVDNLWRLIRDFSGTDLQSDIDLSEFMEESLLIFFGPEGTQPVDSLQATVLYSDCKGTRKSFEVPDGWETSKRLLNKETPHQDIPCLRSNYITLVCYFLFWEHTSDSKQGDKDLSRLNQLLYAPVYRVNSGALMDVKTKQLITDVTTLANQKPPSYDNASYYQRVLGIFGCSTKEAANKLEIGANHILAVFIRSWGQYLEEHKRRLEGEMRQYRMQAHETRKIIPLVDHKTPADVLLLVKKYFYLLFMVPSGMTDPEASPDGWAVGDDFTTFCKNAIQVAAEMESLVSYALGHETFTDTRTHLARVVPAAERVRISEARSITRMKNIRINAFGALVVVFRNVISHSPPHTPINIDITRNGREIVIRNQALIEPVMGSPTVIHRFSSQNALSYYVGEMGQSLPTVPFNMEENCWITRIPVPKQLWGNN